MQASFSVELEKEYHVFSAAHFITFAGNICERLHGHNYRVKVAVPGPLDENAYVIDFILLRDTLKGIVDELDHRMLLPDSHPLIQVNVSASEVEVRFTPDSRRWIFPLGDCLILPVANTTAELLAQYIGQQIYKRLEAQGAFLPAELEIGVDENHGQWGVCRLKR